MDTRLNITKGNNNSAKNVGGVTVVNLCMLSVMLYISTGHALYFYQVL